MYRYIYGVCGVSVCICGVVYIVYVVYVVCVVYVLLDGFKSPNGHVSGQSQESKVTKHKG